MRLQHQFLFIFKLGFFILLEDNWMERFNDCLKDQYQKRDFSFVSLLLHFPFCGFRFFNTDIQTVIFFSQKFPFQYSCIPIKNAKKNYVYFEWCVHEKLYTKIKNRWQLLESFQNSFQNDPFELVNVKINFNTDLISNKDYIFTLSVCFYCYYFASKKCQDLMNKVFLLWLIRFKKNFFSLFP